MSEGEGDRGWGHGVLAGLIMGVEGGCGSVIVVHGGVKVQSHGTYQNLCGAFATIAITIAIAILLAIAIAIAVAITIS